METSMIITIFILFVLYTLACIADGPDVKPLWKRWLGRKLEGFANELKPIDYCHRGTCRFYHDHLNRARPSQQISLDCSTSNIRLLEKNYIIGEDQLYQARRDEDQARKMNLPLPPNRTVDGMISEYKQMLIEDLIRELKPFVSIAMIHNDYDYDIRLIGRILVGKPKERNI